jgi:Spy/CpxP family protein refolding chaperone
MKQHWTKFALAAALASGLAVAQSPQPQERENRAGMRGPRRGHMLERLAKRLNLTEAQKEQAKAAFQAAQEQAKPLRQQLKQTHQELADAVKTGKTDVEIDQITARQGALMGQLAAVRSKAMAKVYATLTPEQRQKADELHNQFRGMQRPFGARAGRG